MKKDIKEKLLYYTKEERKKDNKNISMSNMYQLTFVVWNFIIPIILSVLFGSFIYKKYPSKIILCILIIIGILAGFFSAWKKMNNILKKLNEN